MIEVPKLVDEEIYRANKLKVQEHATQFIEQKTEDHENLKRADLVYEMYLLVQQDREKMDQIDELEQLIDESLSSFCTEELVTSINNIMLESPIEYKSDKTKDFSFNIPRKLKKEGVIATWGANRQLVDIVEEYRNMYFDSRAERIEVKQQIQQLMQSEDMNTETTYEDYTDIVREIFTSKTNLTPYDTNEVQEEINNCLN